jgi:hypothetical protein
MDEQSSTSETSPEELRQWISEFEAAARRPLATRMKYAFIKTYRPVMDDAPYRSFDTMEDYRRWCEENLPDWLGYGRV